MADDWNVLEEETPDSQEATPSPKPPSEPRPTPRYPVDEKWDEKTTEKPGAYQEKWARDRLSGFVWGSIVVWAGLVFLMANLNAAFLGIRWENTWSWILLGAGVVLLVGVVLRQILPDYRRPVGGTLILAVVLLAIGLGGIIDIETTWPLILIAVGLATLIGAFRKAA